MAGEDDKTRAPDKPAQGQDRQARLEQALRANLLKRKEKARATKVPPPPSEEGRQT
ncbi:hypothetical protein [Methyloceanibacter sp.]|jgi:hypothetical protein|uniref:hypothetical protein n=1 Tax=Methyloceanibacter sp. TaxID=1965321 RepID=UPI003567EB43